jgi:hypothetical protein
MQGREGEISRKSQGEDIEKRCPFLMAFGRPKRVFWGPRGSGETKSLSGRWNESFTNGATGA